MIAREVIEFIKERTAKGVDKNNKKFKGYSKPYKNSLEFKVAGKTSKVDLRLSGEMLAELELLTDRAGSITIGYDATDKKLNEKVEGNIKGTYGQKKSTGKARDFLGIKEKDLNNILKKYKPESEKIKDRFQDLLKSAAAAEKILGQVQTRSEGGQLPAFEEE